MGSVVLLLLVLHTRPSQEKEMGKRGSGRRDLHREGEREEFNAGKMKVNNESLDPSKSTSFLD